MECGVSGDSRAAGYEWGFRALVTPAVPMVTDYLTEEIVASGMIRLSLRR